MRRLLSISTESMADRVALQVRVSTRCSAPAPVRVAPSGAALQAGLALAGAAHDVEAPAGHRVRDLAAVGRPGGVALVGGAPGEPAERLAPGGHREHVLTAAPVAREGDAPGAGGPRGARVLRGGARQAAQAAAVGSHRVDVLIPGAIAREGDALSARRP